MIREFLTERAGRGVLLQIGGQGVRGLVHDLDDTTVTLWNPKLPFRTVPLEVIDGYSAWPRMDWLASKYQSCIKSMTCALHYPPG